MDALKIVDLSFLDGEFSSSQVSGGLAASVSNSYQGNYSGGYYGSWSVYPSGHGYAIAANIYAYSGLASAGAISGAGADGSVYATSYAQARTS